MDLKFTIRTVHGTFAADANKSDYGDKWWQKGSNFSKELLSYLDTENFSIEWEPFHWSGENSVRGRYKAQVDLANEMKMRFQTDPTRSYIYICHSHGGNVYFRAALEAASREIPLFGNPIYVGTPFIPNTGIGEEETKWWVAHIRWRFWFLLASAGLLFLLWLFAPTGILGSILVWAALLTSGLLITGFAFNNNNKLIPRLEKLAIFVMKRLPNFDPSKGTAEEQLFTGLDIDRNQREIKLFSREDEAINGLRKLPKARVQIAETNTARKPAAAVITALVFACLIALQLIFQIIDTSAMIEQISATRFLSSVGNDWVLPFFLQGIMALGFSSAVAVAIVRQSDVPASIVARLINRLIEAILRSRGFGDDGALRTPHLYNCDSNYPLLYGSYPPGARWKALPTDFDAGMEPILAEKIVASMTNMREVLAMGLIAETPEDGKKVRYSEALGKQVDTNLFHGLKQAFSAEELVHTNYFNHPDFAPFIAFLLAHHHFPVSPRYKEVDEAKYARWLAEIRPEAFETPFEMFIRRQVEPGHAQSS